MDIKMFVAVAALAFAGSAHAALDESSSGASELLLNIFDPVNDLSYSQDLGLSFDMFLENIENQDFRLSFGLNPGALSVFESSDRSELQWNIGAVNNSFLDLRTLGVLTTVNPFSSPSPVDTTANSILAQNYNDLARGLNRSVDASPTDQDDVYVSDNNAVSNQVRSWSNGLGGAAGFSNSASVDQDMSMFFLAVFNETFSGQGPNIESAALWSLDLDDNTLGYNAMGHTVIPLPAAVWMLLSGLIGLVITSRRRTTA